MDTIKILTGTPTEIDTQLRQILPWPGHEVRSQNTVLTPGGGIALTLHLRRTHLAEGEYLCDADPQFIEDTLQDWLKKIGRYCPKGARLVAER